MEQNLVHYVINNSPKGNIPAILETIDKFCNKNWMMNVGDKKGAILEQTISGVSPTEVLEIGLYCGYSALRIISKLPKNGHLYSIEVDQNYINCATSILTHAQVQDRITILHGTLETVTFPDNKHAPMDAIFMDHAKEAYMPDFLRLKECGLLGCNTVIILDNMKYPGSPELYEYLTSHPQMYHTEIYKTTVEYSDIPDEVFIVSLRVPQSATAFKSSMP